MTRASNTTLRLPAEFPVVGYGLTNAFGDLRFDEPVVMTFPPGETNRLFVAERTGRIMVITNLASPTKTEFIDLGLGELHAAYVEAGLLGFTFHPGYRTNGQFFVFRTIVGAVNGLTALYDEVARFQVDPQNRNRALPDSKLRILAQHDISLLHNGGSIQFGPDDYLYISTGHEGPPPGTPPNLLQSIDEHVLGAILRIDVDKRPGNLVPNPHSSVTTNYLIPADNPFIGATSFNGMPVEPDNVRTELYAVGLRNPWGITFDEMTGDMYCADVGGALVEEVNLVRAGANFGWPFYEGSSAGPASASTPSKLVHTEPLYRYAHGSGLDEGGCIIGGPVYWGDRIAQLRGAYIFGDNGNGRIWALRRNGTGVTAEYLVSYPNQKTFGLTTFGTDPRNHDVLAANLAGHIVRLIYVPPEEEAQYPGTLAETGAFANPATLEPNSGVVPFEINVPFWSDNAIKSRWFSVPDQARIGFSISNNWTFPTGTVWVKHFELETTNGVASSRRPIETRLLVKNELGIYGVTYRWGNSRTNAELVSEGGMEEVFVVHDGASVRTQKWHYPSRAECLRCHTAEAGYALGFNTAQLNRSHGAGIQNQIESLSAAGYLDAVVPSARNYPILAHATNSAWPIEYRLRSYLSANCVQCHYPGGPPITHWDARFTTPMGEARLVNAASALLGDPFRVIAPHDLGRSVLYGRISNGEMPPLATTVLNTSATALLAEYIDTFPEPPWRVQDVGSTGREGSSSISNGVHRVAGAGTNIAGAADQFHFLFQPLTANSHLIARVVDVAPSGKAGIMFRQSVSPDDRFAMLTVQSNRSGWQFRAAAGEEILQSDHGPARWLRLLREGTSLSGFISDNGVQWLEVGSASGLGGDFLAGLAVSSLDNAILETAAFDQVSILSVSLTADALPAPVSASDTVQFEAHVAARGNAIQSVEFYDGVQRLGKALTAPYRFRWTNLIAGTHSIQAVAVDAAGNFVSSEPLDLTVQLPAARSRFSRKDASTRGNWRARYGSDGSILAGDSTNLPAHITFEMTGERLETLQGFANQALALQRASGTGRAAAVWTTPTNFSFDLSLLDGELHSVSLYFVDFDTRNRRVQKVDVIDLESGQVLQSQSISRFSRGVYLTFFVRGAIRFQVSHVSGPDAVLSGVFIQPATFNPARIKISAAGKLQFTLPAKVVLSAKVTGGDMRPASVEMFVDGQKIGEAKAPLYGTVWSNALPGVHTLVAQGTDPLGTLIKSAPANLVVKLPPTMVEEVATDTVRQGNWRGAYGTEGYAIAAHATNFPAYADVSFATPAVNVSYPTPIEYIWSACTTDPRALLREDGPDGIMSAWVWTDFTIDVAIRDGRNHIVTLYFLDPESARLQRVEVIDAAKGKIIDQREIGRFDGHYISWSIRGHVRFRTTAILGNAVVSGIFFDPKGSVYSFGTKSGVRLDLVRTPDGVELSWTTTESEMVLQSKNPLSPSSGWSALPNPRVISGNKITVRDSIDAEGKFYRLAGPTPP